MARAPQKTRARSSSQEEAPAPSTRRSRGALTEQKGGKELTNWEAELEQQAQVATEMEKGAPMGRNFSFKGGQMVFDGAPVKDNEVVVIIAGACIEKAYYDGVYDPDNPEAPVCFAFDTDPDELAPNPDDVADLQSPTCKECPHNVFGSADRGRGKACKDVRRLALIPAGTFQKNGDIELVEDAKEIEKAELGFAKLPPTSLTPYAAFVRQVASTMKRPPHGIYSIMRCTPDPKTQFVVTFEPIDLVGAKLLPAVMARHKEAMDAIMLPYTYPDPEEQGRRPKPSARGRGPKPNAKPGQGRAPSTRTASSARGQAGGGNTRSRKY